MKKFFRIIVTALAVVILVLVALVQPIDRTPYVETEHYRAWKEWIADQQFTSTSGALSAGWSKRNITPLSPGPMSGYGNRWGKHFEGVLDSVYVRVLALRNAETTVYFLSADMLIIPPDVATRLEGMLAKDGIALSQVHLAATHTHHSLGGWGHKLAGRLFSGKFDEDVEIRLSELFYQAIMSSTDDMAPAEIVYSQSKDVENIRYRLAVEHGGLDDWIRSLVVKRSDGKQAELITYAAHPTMLRAKFLNISRDYPGILVDTLESLGNDFALFMAGSVGSIGANAEGVDNFEQAHNMVKGLVEHLKDSVEMPLSDTITSAYFEIPMPKQTARISLGFALRPWVFNAFFGKYPTYIKVTKIGKVLILGMPADFSGEIMSDLDAYADQQGIELMITSFNGSYIGYITSDKVYDSNEYETTIMSWNGYQSGGYLAEVAKDIIDKFAVK